MSSISQHLDPARLADLARDPDYTPTMPKVGDFFKQAQAAAADRSNGVKPSPITRAERIIASGHGRRVAFGKLNPSADTAMVYGAQIGYLHGEVQRLCAELESFNIVRDPDLGYCTVCCDELGADVLVGYSYEPGSPERITSGAYYERTGDPGDPGDPESIEVMEVWCNGMDIAGAILERVAEQLSASALDKVHADQEYQRDSDEAARSER